MSKAGLGKISIFLSCLIIIVGLISTIVNGQANDEVISYIYAKVPRSIGFNSNINIKVGLKNKSDSPIVGAKYGDPELPGTWFIDSLKDYQGNFVKYKVIGTKELGDGNYQVDIKITSWIEKPSNNKYTIRLGYADKASTDGQLNKVYLDYTFSVKKASIMSEKFPPRINLLNYDPSKIYYFNRLYAGTTITINGSYEVFGSSLDFIQTSMDGINWHNAEINQKALTWSADIILPNLEGKYHLYFRGKDKAGLDTQGTRGLNIIVDNTPSQRTKLEGSADKGGKLIKLHWKQAKDKLSGIDHYLIYKNNKLIRPYYLDKMRAGKNGYFFDNFALDKVTTDRPTQKSSKITNEYTVASVDKAGNISASSNTLKVAFTPRKTKAASYSIASLNIEANAAVSSFDSPHGNYETGYRTSYCAACHSTHNSNDVSLVKESESQLCLECHNGNGSSMVISGYIEGAAHYNSDKGYSCKTCHNSHGTQYNAFLRYSTNNQLCLICHNGTSGDNVKSDYTKTNGHKSVSCTYCHNPHKAESNNALLGVSGVSVNRNSFPAFTYKSVVSQEYELCYRCHSEYSTLVSQGDVIAATDAAIDFNPQNLSYHAVEGGSKAEFISDTTFRGLDNNGNPWSYNSKVHCTDCHGSAITYSNEPGVKGVHGSSNLHLLKGWYDTSKTLQDIKDNPDNFLCFRCHNPNVYINKDATGAEIGSNFTLGNTNLHNNGKHDFPCWQCHGQNIHGKNREHLIAYQKEEGTSLITEYTHADRGYYDKSNCTTTCHN